MQTYNDVVNDAMREYQGGKSTYLLIDPVINVTRIIYDQQKELQRLKAATSDHVYVVTGQDGKPVLTPLDGELGRIQQQIAVLGDKISINLRIAAELEKTCIEMGIVPPLAVLEEQARDRRSEIERAKQELNTALLPYRQAAEKVRADLDAIPEVVELRRAHAANVTALGAEARGVEEMLARITTILQGVQR